ncbi:MAG: FeoA family protein [Thermoplasmatota archaeon]
MILTLAELPNGGKGKIIRLEGGLGFNRQLKTRGIRPGKEVKIVSKHFRGPIVISIAGRQISIGRGMAERIIVETSR